jgi:hypothetical protein
MLAGYVQPEAGTSGASVPTGSTTPFAPCRQYGYYADS